MGIEKKKYATLVVTGLMKIGESQRGKGCITKNTRSKKGIGKPDEAFTKKQPPPKKKPDF